MSAPRHSIFISYRRQDTAFAADILSKALREAFGGDAVFRDVHSIRKGQEFPDDIRAALAMAKAGLVIIGPFWLTITSDPKDPASTPRLHDPDDWVRQEVKTLLHRESTPGANIPVIPIYTGGAGAPPADALPDDLKSLALRNGQKLDVYPATEHSIKLIIESLAAILDVTPRALPESADEPAEPTPRFGGNGFTVTGKKFAGRGPELHLLNEAWGRTAGDKLNIVSFIGQGGEGKSALVLEWLKRRRQHGWQGARRVFEWSFYSQGTSAQNSAGAEDFFNAAFAWLDYRDEIPKDSYSKGGKLAGLFATERTLLVLDGLEPLQQPPGGYGGEFKDPAMKALLRGLARHNPGLCILTSRTEITDLADFTGADGAYLSHRLQALDTHAARQLLRELGVLGPDRELDEAIAWFHGHAYDLNLLGNYLAKCTIDHDIRSWQQRFPILKEDERIHGKPDGTGKRSGHGRRMLRAYERWFGPDSPALAALRLLGFFDRPVRSDLLDELHAGPVIPGLTEPLVNLGEDDWLYALDGLQQLALVTRAPFSLPDEKPAMEDDPPSAIPDIPDGLLALFRQRKDFPAEMKRLSDAELKQLLAQALTGQKLKTVKPERPRRPVSYLLDTHPLLREHFATDLREQKNGEPWRQGHRRLYAYLCATTPDKPDATLEDLQPLYQAVAHGCQAGLQQEACNKVYRDRIQRGGEAYSTLKLGALSSDLGAIACFFETPWRRVSSALSETAQAWLLNEAAFHLHALGRLAEALEPMRGAMKNLVRQDNWESAAVSANNLGELELTLGKVAEAVTDAGQAVTYADRSGNTFWQMGCRTTHADALHQAGRWAEAEALFREAEQMQAEEQPEYPLLYSLQSFRYCDLLLSEAERAAAKGKDGVNHKKLLADCRDVEQRAKQTLQWAKLNGASLLSFALEHLALGRAELYRAILDQTDFQHDIAHIGQAVDGLRRSGQQPYLPQGLLTRAWLRSLTGPCTGPESAQSDLDEAWEIAERGPMPLCMADIHLYRARLFYRKAKYPWESPQADLAEARRLIEKHRYWRRKEELEDTEEMVNGALGEN